MTQTDTDKAIRIYLQQIPEHVKRSEIRALQAPMLQCALMDLGFSSDGEVPGALSIERTEHGKPYLPQFPGFHYNFSDSGSFLALAASARAPVGIDIQEIKKPARGVLHLADRFFSKEEAQMLRLAADESAQLSMFIRLWAIKEAYLKYAGLGLAGGLDSCPADLETGQIEGAGGPAVFTEPPAPEGYSLCVCSSSSFTTVMCSSSS